MSEKCVSCGKRRKAKVWVDFSVAETGTSVGRRIVCKPCFESGEFSLGVLDKIRIKVFVND